MIVLVVTVVFSHDRDDVHELPLDVSGRATTASSPTERIGLTTFPAAGGSQGPSSASRRLASALTGLGFAPRDVRGFVAQVGQRAEREPVEAFIVEGLRVLAPPALAS